MLVDAGYKVRAFFGHHGRIARIYAFEHARSEVGLHRARRCRPSEGSRPLRGQLSVATRAMRIRRSWRTLSYAILSLSCACAEPIRAGLLHDRRSPPVAPRHAPFESPRIEALLRSRPRLVDAVNHAADYRFQVLLSVPKSNGAGWQRREGFRVDAEYFYPASAIKPCIAVAALETLGELRNSIAPGLDVRASFTSERRRSGVTVGMLLTGSLIVSDNDASDDLLDLASFDGLHRRMWRMGLSSVRVRHRMGSAPGDDARTTPRVELTPRGTDPSPVVIPAQASTVDLGENQASGVQVGAQFIEGGHLVDGPMSFDDRNRISLVDLQDVMVAIARPDMRRPEQRTHLPESERSAIVDALSTLPRRWGMSAELEVEHKPLLPGIERVRARRHLKIASKSGRAFGFVVDNAYVVDRKSGRSFFLTVALYANANGRLNDDHYEYGSFAYPVIADVGEVAAHSVFDDPS